MTLYRLSSCFISLRVLLLARPLLRVKR